MIYAPVFAAGSVALTRVSKALRNDTKGELYRHGVYRVHIRSSKELDSPEHATYRKAHAAPERETWGFPDRILAKVQNFQLRVSLDHESRTGLTPTILGKKLGVKCWAVHAQLAKHFISCTKYSIVFPDGAVISQTEIECFDLWWMEWLRSIVFEWYLDGRWHRPKYDGDDIERIEAFLGFHEGCFGAT